MASKDIRQYAKEHGARLWQCAAAMGISEPTMTRRLRTELTEQAKQELIHIIDGLSANADPTTDEPQKGIRRMNHKEKTLTGGNQ